MSPSVSHNQPAFGHHALSPWREWLRLRAGQLRARSRITASFLRRLSTLGLREPFDVQPAAGFKVRLFPSNNVTDKKAYLGLEIEPGDGLVDAIDQAVSASPQDEFHFLDIGGNSGMMSLAAAQAAQRHGKTIHIAAIEANPAMAERYQFNLSASGVENVALIRAAVSDQPGTIWLDLSSRNLGRATVTHDATPKSVEVLAKPLADIAAETGLAKVDFLKIDIEGHELPALQPYFETVEPALWPNHILVETDHDKDGAIDELLTRIGYTMTTDLNTDAVYTLKREML